MTGKDSITNVYSQSLRTISRSKQNFFAPSFHCFSPFIYLLIVITEVMLEPIYDWCWKEAPPPRPGHLSSVRWTQTEECFQNVKISAPNILSPKIMTIDVSAKDVYFYKF
jgi:hypothetical protein